MAASNIHSLESFNQNLPENIAHLKKTGEPVVLTVDGRAEVVVQDAGAYQQLLDGLDYHSTVEGIRRGIASLEREGGRPYQKFFAEIASQAGVNPPAP